MSNLFTIAQPLLTDEIKNKISIHINKRDDIYDFNKFISEISVDNTDISKLNYESDEQEKHIWCDIAKLSIDLWLDYDYYRQFIFPSRYDCNEYRERLEVLGCVCDNGTWRSDRRPELFDVQMNVFMHCLYRLTADKMELNVDLYQNDDNDRRQTALVREDRNTMDNDHVTVDLVDTYETIVDNMVDKMHYSPRRASESNNVVSTMTSLFCTTTNNEGQRVTKKESTDVKDSISETRWKNKRRFSYNIKDKVNNEMMITDEYDQINSISSPVATLSDHQLSKNNDTHRRNTPMNSRHTSKNTMKSIKSINTWICESCTFINESSHTKCILCLIERHERVINDDKNKQNKKIKKKDKKRKDKSMERAKNEVIHAPSQVATRSDLQLLSWVCRSCTFINTKYSLRCDACLLDRFNLKDDDIRLDCKLGVEREQRDSEIKNNTQRNISNKKNIDKNISNISHTLQRFPTRSESHCVGDNIFASLPSSSDTTLIKRSDTTFIGASTIVAETTPASTSKTWTCPSCTFINKLTNKCCDMCSIIREIDALQCNVYDDVTMIPMETWKCQCDTINDKSKEYCCKCGLKKGCNVTQFNMVDVHDGDIYRKKWQCTFCGAFNSASKSDKCENMRRIQSTKLCSCLWVSKQSANKCEKCSQILKEGFDN